MSMYNMIRGVNQATFFILPMLGKHPDEYPRFRDCFPGAMKNSEEKDEFGIPLKTTTDEALISVYARVGGGNRHDYNDEIEKMRKMPTYVRDYDDDFDCTYATFIFEVPEKWKEDFDHMMKGEVEKISKEYVVEMQRVFPKLAEKFETIFN